MSTEFCVEKAVDLHGEKSELENRKRGLEETNLATADG